jgi:hypothetical protein
LYQQPHLIGNERGWQTALSNACVRLRGHRLVRIPQAAQHRAESSTSIGPVHVSGQTQQFPAS